MVHGSLFLEKPFGVDRIARELQEALDEKKAMLEVRGCGEAAMNRSGLIATQIVGGLTILPVAFRALVANMMSIAAPWQTKAGCTSWLVAWAHGLRRLAYYSAFPDRFPFKVDGNRDWQTNSRAAAPLLA